ncbi:hypothetical protein HYV57_04545 [Candidatus Peregrinibacteria bacterium]|nr:hypothetical protein [Candidatus Peregrinibacteria bacterium]
MIFNCLRCGKSISSMREVCPYCKIENSEMWRSIGSANLKKAVKEKYKGTILSFVLR